MNKIIVILPTFNEIENIEKLFFLLKKLNLRLSFLFIDHGSTDGTLEIIKKIKNKFNKNVFFISKKHREGIGKAHKDGLKWAYKKKYDLAITMDTDFAHHPKYLKNLIKESKNYDLLVGSRYLKKKSIGWSWWRVFLSNGAHLMSLILFKITHDTTNSFRCYNLNSYDFFYTSIILLSLRKYKIGDMSMQIKGRKSGNSKMLFKHVIKSILNMFLLFIKIRFKIIK